MEITLLFGTALIFVTGLFCLFLTLFAAYLTVVEFKNTDSDTKDEQ